MKLQKGFYLILSIALIASGLAPAVPERTVQAARAFEPALPQEMDEFGNVVREGDQFINFLPDSEGNTVQVTLDSQHNETGRETLARNPFASRSELVTAPDQGMGVPDLSGSNFPVSEEWKFNLYGSRFGSKEALIAKDLDNDGKQEILTSSYHLGNGFWYVLRQTGINQYEQVWCSENYSATIFSIAASDINHDGIDEIILALGDLRIQVFSGADFTELFSFKLVLMPEEVVVADTDQNGRDEVIISDGTYVSANDIMTGQLIWLLSDCGGDLAVGNVDQDADLEIVTGKGYVLNGKTREVEWFYPASKGFGLEIGLGDVDGNGIVEIVGAGHLPSLTVFSAVLKSPLWNLSTITSVVYLLLVDVNGDNIEEIVYSEGMGAFYCLDGLTQTELWNIYPQAYSISNFWVSDVDQDSVQELVYGGDQPDFLMIVSVDTKEVEWKSIDLEGPLYAHDVGDVDDDGQTEIVLGTFSSDSGYGGGTLHIIDATTHELEWQLTELPNIDNWSGIGSIRIADVDDDGTMEFAVATADLYDGVIQIYDGRTHTLEQQSQEFSSVSLTSMEIGDVDGDGKTEIVVGQKRLSTTAIDIRVIVLDGATLSVEWQSNGLDTYWEAVYDIHLDDIDQDGSVEIIAALENGKVYVFDSKTHVMQALIDAQAISIWSADLDGNGTPSLLLGRLDGNIDVYNGQSFQLERTIALTSDLVRCLKLADLDVDGEKEWLVCNPGSLSVFSASSGALLWKKIDNGQVTGMYNQISVGQFDDDSFSELIWGSENHLYQYDTTIQDPFTSSTIQVTPSTAEPGDMVTFRITLVNKIPRVYKKAQLDMQLPDVLHYVEGSLNSSSGVVTIDNNHLVWKGNIGEQSQVAIEFQTKINTTAPRKTYVNTAVLTFGSKFKAIQKTLDVNRNHAFLPVCLSPWKPLCGDFLDNFSNSLSGWAMTNTPDLFSSYVFGEYSVITKNDYYDYLFRAPTCKRSDYLVEMDARWNNATGDGYGIIFDLDDKYSQYYLFMVNSEYQQYALFRYSNGLFQTIAGPFQSQAIRPGLQTNHLRVTRNGAEIRLEINGASVGTWKSQNAASPGFVGLFVSPKIWDNNARFDNFSVIALPSNKVISSTEDPLTSLLENGTFSEPFILMKDGSAINFGSH